MKDSILSIEGLHESGNILGHMISSEYTSPSPKKIAFLEDALKTYNETLNKVEKGTFKDKAELKAYLKSTIPEAPEEQAKYLISKINYAGNVAKVHITVENGAPIQKSTKLLLTPHSYD